MGNGEWESTLINEAGINKRVRKIVDPASFILMSFPISFLYISLTNTLQFAF